MLPSFVVIGGQRCGTTTIFKSLAEHPQVMRPPVEKGTDYYTLNYNRGIDWYQGHFPMELSGALQGRRAGESFAFEACTYYMFHPLAIERLAKDFPNIKLVAMLRDPVERAFSAYKHEYARGFETEPDFQRALDLEDSRLEGELERITSNADYESIPHRHHAYRRRGQYVEQLERVFQHYPREQVHVMESEGFFRDPVGEYLKLTNFLGLDEYDPGHIDQHNARPSSPMPDGAKARLQKHYESYDERLEELLGREIAWRQD